MNSVKMVEVSRSGEVESIHYGSAVLINSSGDILEEWGNSNILIYPRSGLKPIQSLNLYKDGVANGLNISDELFNYKKKYNLTLDKIKSESQLILDSINDKIK